MFKDCDGNTELLCDAGTPLEVIGQPLQLGNNEKGFLEHIRVYSGFHLYFEADHSLCRII